MGRTSGRHTSTFATKKFSPYHVKMAEESLEWRRAAEKGVLCSINPDAHDVAHLSFVEAGVRIARKGWLTAGQIFNTWPLDRVEGHLAGRGR